MNIEPFKIDLVELVALRKLEVVGRALANRLDGTAAIEQRALCQVLTDVLDRYESHAIVGKDQDP